MQKPLVYIIVVSYRNIDATSECLRSLQHIDYPHSKILVIDNHCEGKVAATLKKNFPYINILEMEENLGYGPASMRAITYADREGAPYVLLLNNDTVVKEDFLSHLMRCAMINPQVAIIGPKIYTYGAEGKLWFYKGRMSWLRGMGYNIDRKSLRSNEDVAIPIETGFISGCCMLLNMRLLKKHRLRLFDDRYFLYFEDCDLTQRVRKAGLKLLFCPNAVIWHWESAGLGRTNPLLIYYYTRNRLLFMRDNHPSSFLYLAFLIYFFFSRLFRIAQWVLKGNLRAVKMCIWGVHDFARSRFGRRDS